MSRRVVAAAVGLCCVGSLTHAHVAPAAEPLRAVAATALQSGSSTGSAEADAEAVVEKGLPVIGVEAGTFVEEGQALTWALRRALDASVEWSSPSVDASVAAAWSSAGCSEMPDAECLMRVAKKTGLDHFVWGTLRLVKGHVTARLGLFDGGHVGPATKLDYSAKMTDTFDEDLLRLASAALSQVVGPLRYPVIVRSRERTGELFIDGASVGKLTDGSAAVSATAGDHRIRLVLPDATAIARSFQIRVEHTTLVRLDFIDIPET